jgi:hypothetical protein
MPPIDPQSHIKQWFSRHEHSDGTLLPEDVCFLMVQVRQLIEASGDKKRYRVPYFYATWMMPTELNHSATCRAILRELTQIIAQDPYPTSSTFPVRVSAIIGLHRLREQLLDLFGEKGLQGSIFNNDKNWNQFVKLLVSLVTDHPISFPIKQNKRAEGAHSEELAPPDGRSRNIKKMAIVDVEGEANLLLQVTGEKHYPLIVTVNFSGIPEQRRASGVVRRPRIAARTRKEASPEVPLVR